MKVCLAELVRGTAALAIALGLTFVAAQFVGYPANPAALRGQQARISEFNSANPVVDTAKRDEFFASLARERKPEAPPELVAIIQWLPALFSGAVFVVLLALRPRPLETVIVATASVLVALASAGTMPAVATTIAFGTYFLATLLIPGLRRVVAAA